MLKALEIVQRAGGQICTLESQVGILTLYAIPEHRFVRPKQTNTTKILLKEQTVGKKIA